MSRLSRVLSIAVWLLIPLSGISQESPFLPENAYNKLVNEISGDIAYDNLRSLVMYHATSGGAAVGGRGAQVSSRGASGTSRETVYRSY